LLDMSLTHAGHKNLLKVFAHLPWTCHSCTSLLDMSLSVDSRALRSRGNYANDQGWQRTVFTEHEEVFKYVERSEPMPGARNQYANCQVPMPGARYVLPSTRYQIPGTSGDLYLAPYQVPGIGYLVPGTSYRVPATWNLVPGTWIYLVPVTGYQTPEPACRCSENQTPKSSNCVHYQPFRLWRQIALTPPATELTYLMCLYTTTTTFDQHNALTRELCSPPKIREVLMNNIAFLCLYIYIYIYTYIYIYICLRVRGPTPLPPGKGHGPRLPPVGVGGLVCGGWYDCSDTSELHLLPNRTEQLKISDSCRLT
jgi:hypothetical protein